MDKNNENPEEIVYSYINKINLNEDERKDFFHQLVFLDWNKTSKDYGEGFNDKIIEKVMKIETEDIVNISNLIELYNNPYGVYTEEITRKVSNIYLKDKIKFIKALNLVKDESINIVYVFRTARVFEDDTKLQNDIEEIQNSKNLSTEEKETASMFFTMYKNICAS